MRWGGRGTLRLDLKRMFACAYQSRNLTLRYLWVRVRACVRVVCVCGGASFSTTSHIREAMIKVMASPSVRHPSDSANAPWDRGQFGAVTNGEGSELDGNQHPTDPSACTFWCAVALGALVKGCPVEAVRTIRSCFCL